MRSFFSQFFGRDGVGKDLRGRSHARPEQLRRKVLETNARLIIAAALIALPAGLHGLLQGQQLTFAVCILALAAGTLSLLLHSQNQHGRCAAAQVFGLLAIGGLLTVSDPQIADFGLAVALLAPVHAALLGRTDLRKQSWLGLIVVVLLGSFGLPVPASLAISGPAPAAIVFVVSALLVAITANRLNSVFEVFEKGQINAYRHLIEHVQDAVLRFAADGTLLYASRRTERLLGCHRYELTGGGLIERIHVLDRPAYMTAFAEANKDGLTRRVEIRMRRDERDQSAHVPHFVWVEASLSPVLDAGTTARQHEVLALLRDITDRHDSDLEMRTARKAAEAASDAKSRFLATIGHELRTPLNAIVGFSEMMSSGIGGELPPQQRDYARLIHASGRHLIEVVQMLLDMSRLEAGKFELQAEPLTPESLVQPSICMVEGPAREKRVRIEQDLAQNLPTITADERALRQVLINLLSNAVKFSEPDSVVRLSLRKQGRFLNLTVADRGIGMSADALARVGEPFFQANDGLGRRYEGTGLGLSIVKGLVELHDGQLHVASTPGEGTTVTVLLPINGPETKLEETASITPLHRDPAPQQTPQWHEDGKRRAL